MKIVDGTPRGIAIESSAEVPGMWLSIDSVPKNEFSLVDLWCKNISHGSIDECRFADMFMNKDGVWEDWHGYELDRKWKPTHWMYPPPGPNKA